MKLVRKFTLISIQNNVRFFARYVNTKENTRADALSRGQFERFWSAAATGTNKKKKKQYLNRCGHPANSGATAKLGPTIKLTFSNKLVWLNFRVCNAIKKKKNSGSSRSSGSSRISLRQLQLTAENLCNQQHCPSTGRMYHHAWKNFNDLLVALDERPSDWNDKIMLFAAQLIVEKHPVPTIKSYVSAVKSFLRDDGIEIDDNSVMLSSLIKSCKYMTCNRGLVRLPIQLGLLNIILRQMDNFFLVKKNQPYLALLYKSITLFGYYGMMRVGELTEAESDHTVNFSDVHLDRIQKQNSQ